MKPDKSNWSLNVVIYCKDCKVECIMTEKGVLCPSCGGFINEDEEDNHYISRR